MREVLRLLHDAGLRVILNVLGGLPGERAESHASTVSFIEECTELVWLYNLYSFVPYPLTPLFPGAPGADIRLGVRQLARGRAAGLRAVPPVRRTELGVLP